MDLKESAGWLVFVFLTQARIIREQAMLIEN